MMKNENMIFILNLSTELEAHMAAAELDKNGLESEIRSADPKRSLEKLEKGYFAKGFDIYVRENEYELAKSVLKEFVKEQLTKIENVEQGPWYKNPKKLAWGILGWGIIVLLALVQLSIKS